LTKRLLDGELDLVYAPVVFWGGHDELIQSESLLRTDPVVLVRAGHPADDGKNRTIRDLTRFQWALPRGTFVRKRFDHLFEAYGMIPPTPTVEVNDVSTALDIVAYSELATLTSSVTPFGQERAGYGHVKCDELVGGRDTGILSRKHSVIPPLGEDLCRQLKALVKNHVHSVI